MMLPKMYFLFKCKILSVQLVEKRTIFVIFWLLYG